MFLSIHGPSAPGDLDDRALDAAKEWKRTVAGSDSARRQWAHRGRSPAACEAFLTFWHCFWRGANKRGTGESCQRPVRGVSLGEGCARGR
jgi:hypothetical protein